MGFPYHFATHLCLMMMIEAVKAIASRYNSRRPQNELLKAARNMQQSKSLNLVPHLRAYPAGLS